MANASLQVVYNLEQSSPPSWHTLRVRGGVLSLKLTVNA